MLYFISSYQYFVFISILYKYRLVPTVTKVLLFKFHFNLHAFISFQVV